MEAISGQKTIKEIAADQAIHPIQQIQWKKQLLEGASELLLKGRECKTKDQDHGAVTGEMAKKRHPLPASARWRWNGSTEPRASTYRSEVVMTAEPPAPPWTGCRPGIELWSREGYLPSAR
mgnify:CR=1 FL=1